MTGSQPYPPRTTSQAAGSRDNYPRLADPYLRRLLDFIVGEKLARNIMLDVCHSPRVADSERALFEHRSLGTVSRRHYQGSFRVATNEARDLAITAFGLVRDVLEVWPELRTDMEQAFTRRWEERGTGEEYMEAYIALMRDIMSIMRENEITPADPIPDAIIEQVVNTLIEWSLPAE